MPFAGTTDRVGRPGNEGGQPDSVRVLEQGRSGIGTKSVLAGQRRSEGDQNDRETGW